MLEQSRCAGAFEAAQSPVACFARVRGEGRCARRVVDSQMVFVPVAAMFTQPCCLEVHVSVKSAFNVDGHTGMGPMKKRRDVR